MTASFLTAKGLNTLSKSDVDDEATCFAGLEGAVSNVCGDCRRCGADILGFEKKADINDRDLFWASRSLRSFSALVARFSAFSASCIFTESMR